jgi:hypothetical protein
MNSARFVLIGFFLSLFSTLAAAQTTTGYPPYGSFEVGVFDGVNRGNLNTNFSIPVTHFKGRGLDVNVALATIHCFGIPLHQPGRLPIPLLAR